MVVSLSNPEHWVTGDDTWDPSKIETETPAESSWWVCPQGKSEVKKAHLVSKNLS